jgi:hypothetical protein
LGEFGVDVDGDGAEQSDVLALGRGDVGEDLVVDVASLFGNCWTARPRYSAVQVLMALAAMVRHHACSVWS